MKAIIIEDDKENRIQLRALLDKHCRQVTIIGEASGADEGAKIILALKPDLIFLDIQLQGESGFDLLSSLGAYDFEIIFITGYDEYAIQAIRCSALDYILKPVGVTELTNAVTKADRKIKHSRIDTRVNNLLDIVSHPDKLDHKIALPVSKGHLLVFPGDIVYLRSSNNYTNFIMMDSKEILVSKGLYKFEEILADFGFIRCHPSHIVNRKFISRFHKPIGGYEILLTTGIRIPVTPHYVPLVKASLHLSDNA